jgi:hypothetical protein
LTQPTGLTADITQKAIIVTPTADQSKVYGESDPIFTYSNTSLVGDDTMSGSLGRMVGEDAGTYAYTLGTLDAGGNYTLSITADPAEFEITKKAIIVTPTADQSKVYGESDPVFTYSNTSLVGDDTMSGSLGRMVGEDAGTYAYTFGTLDAGGNYTLSIMADPAEFEITKKAITITPTADQSKVYGESDPVFNYTNTPLIGDNSITGNLSRDTGENVGAYAYTLGTLDAGGNYTISIAADPAEFEITKKPVIVMPDAGQNKTYGDSEPVYTYTNFPLEDVDSLTGSMSREIGEKVGTYAYTLGTLDAGDNYTLSMATGSPDFEIMKKDLEVTGAVAMDKIYDATEITEITGAILTGILGTDTVIIDEPIGHFDDSKPGDNRVVAAVITITGPDSGNYNVIQPEGLTATIHTRELSLVGLSVFNKEYDGTTTANISNFGQLYEIMPGDEVSLVTDHAWAYFVSASVGSKNAVIVTGLGITGAGADSYFLSDQSVFAKIFPPYIPHHPPIDDGEGPSDTDEYKAIINDVRYEPAGDMQEKQEEGKTIIDIKLDTDKINKILEKIEDGSDIKLPVSKQADQINVLLNGQMVKDMEDKDAVLIVNTMKVDYIIPADEIDIQKVAKSLENVKDLKDIRVEISIIIPDDNEARFVEDITNESGYTLVIPPLRFKIECTYDDETIEVSIFDSYVKRIIQVPDGIDPAKITTAIATEPDGRIRHIPTKVTVIDGLYYAVVSSLSNSLYSVIWNPYEFIDVKGHLMESEINEMGSRLVINGVGGGRYEPDREISRAEYAAIMVRALGIKPGMGLNPFKDVLSGRWHEEYINTAFSYGIILGYGENIFGPYDNITREQAYTMIARAMNISGIGVGLNDDAVNDILSLIADSDKISLWARNSIAQCFSAGLIIDIADPYIKPGVLITRAEVAYLARLLLILSDLI